MGGHPIDNRKKPPTLYFLPTTADAVRFEVGLSAFNGAFKKTKARRIFDVELIDVPAATLFPGFDAPTEAEFINLNALRQASAKGKIRGRIDLNVHFDCPFICKMVLAVGYSVFGDPFLATKAAPTSA